MKNMDALIGCRYIGRLKNNPWSSVVVTGCLIEPGDQREVTMLSNYSIHSMFTVDYNGNTEIFKDPRGAEAHSWATFHDRDDCNAWHKEGDEMTNDAIEKVVGKATVETIPSVLKATVQFGYNAELEKTFDKNSMSIDSYIARIFTHVQAYFRHPSLGTQIEFESIGPAIRSSDRSNWRANGYGLDMVESETIVAMKPGKNANVFTRFCDTPGYMHHLIAHIVMLDTPTHLY